MHKGKLTFTSDYTNKNQYHKVKKRKFSSIKDESTLNQSFERHKMFKKGCFTEDTVFPLASNEAPKFLFYRSTNAYTKISAKPDLLPCAPKIFNANSQQHVDSEDSHCFLTDLLTLKSFNTDVNERFSSGFHHNNTEKKIKNQKELKKIKKQEELKEINNKEIPKEKLDRSIKNKEKAEKKTLNKEIKEQNELIELQNSNCLNEKEESEISKIDIYKCVKEKALIFLMHHLSKFSFQGEIKLTIIKGEVEILGYTLSENSADVYSPNFCTPLTVETKSSDKEIPVEDLKKKLEKFLSEEDCNKILTNLLPSHSIILVEQIISTFGIVINKYFEKPLFPKDLEDVSSLTKTLKSLQSIFSFNLSKKGKYFKKSIQWDKIPLGQCTVLCGGKGVGKSFLLKYYINKFVTLGEKVLCLDFDPGQCEFTFPGCLSAVVIDQPLLGPNFTHVMDPFLMMSFGDVDVAQNPSKYLECVKCIIENCKKNEELLKMKWFVNTMGFCKGLGVNLMVTILKLLNPNTVIQIKGSDYKNNYPFYLTPTTVNSNSGFRSMSVDDVNLSYDLRVIYSCAEHKKKQLQGGLTHRQLRDIMAISYFSKMVSPPFYNFNAVQPFLIPFSKLYLGVDFLIDPNDILKAFNGNTVSLSHFEPDNEDILTVESEEDVYFKVVVKPKVAPTLGIGLVRGIDCKEKKFYLMTHLPIQVLNSVNCLSLKRISPPHSMFLKQEAVEGQAAYTTFGTADVIQRVKRIFRVPATPQSK